MIQNPTVQHLDDLQEMLCLDVVFELIGIFEQQFQQSQVEFTTMCKNKKYNEARELAHRMKSSAMNLGAWEMGQIYTNLEKQTQVSLNQENLKALDLHFGNFKVISNQWSKKKK